MSPSHNVDVFRHRPPGEISALLPTAEAADQAALALDGMNIEVDAAQILVGVEGARILDRTGTEHGFGARLLRFVQNLGYDQNVLAVYDEGLRKDEALFTVACAFHERRAVVDALLRYGAHEVIYCGSGSMETMTGP